MYVDAARSLRSAVVALSAAAGLTFGQARWVAPRTPWGDPDLQEIWSTEDLRDVPYERPDNVQGRALLTDEEFAERDSRTKQGSARGQTGFANGSKTRTFRQTSLIVDGDGKYPRLTPEALKRVRITDIGTYGGGPFLSAADFNLYDRCITRGVVGSLLPVAYGNGLRIFQTPSQVSSRRRTSRTRPASAATAMARTTQRRCAWWSGSPGCRRSRSTTK